MSVLTRLFRPTAKAQQAQNQRQTELHRSIYAMEARIGGSLFGPIPEGTHREFFCLDERTWVWHEEWQEGSVRQAVTTRYDVRPDGVYKYQGNAPAVRLVGEEARHLYDSVIAYGERVLPELHRLQRQTV